MSDVHECEAMPKEASVYWSVDLWLARQAHSNLVITHCPWCGVALERQHAMGDAYKALKQRLDDGPPIALPSDAELQEATDNRSPMQRRAWLQGAWDSTTEPTALCLTCSWHGSKAELLPITTRQRDHCPQCKSTDVEVKDE